MKIPQITNDDFIKEKELHVQTIKLACTEYICK